MVIAGKMIWNETVNANCIRAKSMAETSNTLDPHNRNEWSDHRAAQEINTGTKKQRINRDR